MDEAKIKRQWDREVQSVEDGVEKYRDALDPDAWAKHGSFNPLESWPEFKTIARNVGALAAALEREFPADPIAFSTLHRSWAAEFKALVQLIFSEVTYEEAAFLTLQYAIRFMFVNEKRFNYSAILRPAADAILVQCNFKRFRREFPAYVDAIIKNRRSNDPDHIKAVLSVKQTEKGIKTLTLNDKQKIILGGLLLHNLCESTGLFEFSEVFDQAKGRTSRTLTPKQEFMDFLDKSHSYLCQLQPVDVPMIVKPERWTGTYRGGFLSNLDRTKKHSILRQRHVDLRDNGFERVSEEFVDALQALQEVPWAVNGRILDVLKIVERNQSGLGGAPLTPLPMRLPREPWIGSGMEPDEFKEKREEEFKIWKIARTMEYTRFHNESSMRAVFRVQLAIAEEFRDEPEFYYCYNADWRGRVYTLQNCGLNPQGDDTAKALLQFAEKKPLGPAGLFWLGVHAANNFGFDKASFDERYAWAVEHHQDIMAAAEAPFDSKWWADADKPYQFLAACFEWAEAHKLADPTQYRSALPIGMDASCSGSQQFSGLLRDPIGGKAVNLVPGDKPSDIYALVAAESEKIMRAENTPEGQVWLTIEGGFGRKWTKRNTMTMPYSASLYGFTEQLIEEHIKDQRKHGAKKFTPPAGVRQGKWTYQVCSYLAKTNRVAISRVVVKMFEAMEWLREVAGLVAKAGRDITWTTPVGLKVVQRYHKSTVTRINLFFGDVRYRMSVSEETEKPNIDGHKNGISPNFIHSLDAAHLMRIAGAFAGRHKKALGVIHDSFSTHACDVELMRDVIRGEFVLMYADSNLLHDLYRGLVEANPDLEIPPPPAQGSLDVRVVEDSAYFIS